MATAQGAILYDTLGPDNSYQMSGSTIGGTSGQVVGDWIHVDEDGVVGSITLAAHHNSGENLYQLDFALPGVNGPGDSPFYSIQFSLEGGNLTTITLENGPALQADTDVWMVFSGIGEGTQGAWWINNNGILGTMAWRDNPPPSFGPAAVNWTVLGDQWMGGARLNTGVPSPVATPEPSTALLAAPALLALGLLRRKRR